MANASLAVDAYRHHRQNVKGRRKYTPEQIAQRFRVTVPELHKAANCNEGERCTGRGCKLGSQR